MVKKVDYTALRAELDEALAILQSDDMSIDEAVAAYERGLRLIKELEQYLQTAENKVAELKAKIASE